MRIWYLYFFIVLYIWCVFGNKLELMLKLLNLEENLLLNLKKSFLIDRVFFMLFLNFFINLSRIFCVMLFWNRGMEDRIGYCIKSRFGLFFGDLKCFICIIL